MEVKIFEIRDRMTFFPVIAIQLKFDEADYEESYAEMYLLMRAGFDPGNLREGNHVVLAHASGGEMNWDPHRWGGRTYPVAHQYITEKFEFLPHGAVIDVEYILGETSAPKQSKRFNEIVNEINSKG